MATYNIGNRKHLTLADRAAIEHGIQIGEKLFSDCSQVKQGFFHHLKGDTASYHTCSSLSG